jgi:hypothetical protein
MVWFVANTTVRGRKHIHAAHPAIARKQVA